MRSGTSTTPRLPQIRSPRETGVEGPESIRRKKLGVRPTFTGPIFAPEAPTLRCKRCKQNVDSISRVFIGSEPFHPKCLQCSVCHTENTELYLNFKGNPVCERCAYQLPEYKKWSAQQKAARSPRGAVEIIEKCMACDTNLEGKIITAMGRRYHSKCFVCSACGQSFETDTKFAERDGKPFHLSCATHVGPLLEAGGGTGKTLKCTRCGTLIKGGTEYTTIPAMGTFHKHCVTCSKCKNPLAGGRVYEDATTGALICLACAPVQQQ
eukprot:TRINITY_DN46854_c0_g1_i1.p1 TRINITY_DN46854_c0_g1~~TRINITY_DN46854_c0_g1_i1.p1  ORF type:complete len:266 (-),score=8.78 TRINITY_DN46854_c0_g1_i1:103-900(-)